MATLLFSRRGIAAAVLGLVLTGVTHAQSRLQLGPAQAAATAPPSAPATPAGTNASAAAPIATSPVAPAAPAPPVVDKRAENAELLRIAQRRLEAAGPEDSAAVQEVALYQSLDFVLSQHETVEQQIRDLTARRAELETAVQAAKTQTASVGQPPKFADLDRLKDEVATEEAQARLVEDKLTSTKTALESAQQTFDDAERVRRQAEEAADNGKDQPNAVQLAVAAEQARQAAKLAGETFALRKLQVTREELAGAIQKLAIEVYQEKIAHMRPLVAFSEADYEAQLAKVKKHEDAASTALANAQPNLQAADLQLSNALKAFEMETGDRALAGEKLEACRRAQERLTTEIDSQTQKLQRQAQLRVAWSRRFKMPSVEAAANDKETWDLLKSWQKEARRDIADLERDTRSQVLRMRDLRNMMSSVAKKAEAAKEGPPALLVSIDRQRAELEGTLRIHEANLVAIESCRRVNEKLQDEVYDTLPDVSPRNLAWDAWNQAVFVWNTPLGAIEDSSITVGKVALCLVVFISGFLAARFFSGLFANRFLRHFKLSKDATAVVRSLAYYLILASVTLIALQIVKVPLTAFTIFGGALAIGVGFGSQALINNFVGGLIMLAERPVRLGDRIIFGNFDGVVEDVGFRCTKLRTATDHLITIPNSTLVNDSIENTARRRTIRRLLNITISYETPRDRIALAVQAIRDILDEKGIRERIHPIVGFEELRPHVHFNEFNADSLNLQVVYWYAPPESWAYMEHAERVNHRIMEEFERLEVNFAFPSKNMVLVNDTGPRLGRSNVA